MPDATVELRAAQGQALLPGQALPPGQRVPGEFSVRGGVRAAYQPIVSLEDGALVAVEALARGQAQLAGLAPLEMFAAAERVGLASDLDWECRAAAMRGALDAGLGRSLPVFVNVEPRWLTRPCPEHLLTLFSEAAQHLRLVFEVTERHLVDDPAGLLTAVRSLRRAGCGIALDDVGAEPASLALLPLVEPDVVKLDLRLVQARTDRDTALIVSAVRDYAERTGAVVLAEGIETLEHEERAVVLGATLGQGWRYGRPGPLPVEGPAADGRRLEPSTADLLPVVSRGETTAGSPFEAVEQAAAAGTLRTPIRVAGKGVLLPMSHLLEQYPLHAEDAPVLLSAFEDVRHFTPGTSVRYSRLAQNCSFVGALGAGMPADPVAGVRGAPLAEDDPLCGEWAVVVLAPHYAGALIAKDLGDGEPGRPPVADRDRRFAFVFTHDRPLVTRAARALLSRVTSRG